MHVLRLEHVKTTAVCSDWDRREADLNSELFHTGTEPSCHSDPACSYMHAPILLRAHVVSLLHSANIFHNHIVSTTAGRTSPL